MFVRRTGGAWSNHKAIHRSADSCSSVAEERLREGASVGNGWVEDVRSNGGKDLWWELLFSLCSPVSPSSRKNLEQHRWMDKGSGKTGQLVEN